MLKRKCCPSGGGGKDRFGRMHDHEDIGEWGGPGMIWLTNLRGDEFVLNAELIESVESRPDTTIILVNGRRYIVKESVEEVVTRVIEYKRRIFGIKAGV